MLTTLGRFALALASAALVLLSAGGALLGLSGVGYSWSRYLQWSLGHAILLGLICIGSGVGLAFVVSGRDAAVRRWLPWVYMLGVFTYCTAVVWDALSVHRSLPWYAALADALINAGAAVLCIGLWRATVWHRAAGDG